MLDPLQNKIIHKFEDYFWQNAAIVRFFYLSQSSTFTLVCVLFWILLHTRAILWEMCGSPQNRDGSPAVKLWILTFVGEIGDGERAAAQAFAASSFVAGSLRVERVIRAVFQREGTVRFTRLLRFVFIFLWRHFNGRKTSPRESANMCKHGAAPSTSWLKFSPAHVFTVNLRIPGWCVFFTSLELFARKKTSCKM